MGRSDLQVRDAKHRTSGTTSGHVARRKCATAVMLAGIASAAACGGVSPSSHGVIEARVPSADEHGASSEYSGNPGPGWDLTWSDNFTSFQSLKSWNFAQGGNYGNEELQFYSPSNVSLAHGGGLVITATATHTGQGEQCWHGPCDYMSARLDTKGKCTQEYGLFEARIKLPTGQGLWPAFWMEGSDVNQVQSPAAGEIDVIEVNNKNPDTIEAFLHAPAKNYGAYLRVQDSLSSGYHVYAINWTPTGISFLVDGRRYGHVDAYEGWPFDQPFFIILDLAVGGTWPGPPNASTKFPAHMDVSWIHVYKRK
jgi:beta-glucanase (GH16 family)